MGRTTGTEPKSNQNSLRYSDTVKEIVLSVGGNGFNQKFENLVLEYKRTIPEREKKCKELDKEIKNKEKYLREVKEKILYYESIKKEFDNFLKNIELAKKQIYK